MPYWVQCSSVYSQGMEFMCTIPVNYLCTITPGSTVQKRPNTVEFSTVHLSGHILKLDAIKKAINSLSSQVHPEMTECTDLSNEPMSVALSAACGKGHNGFLHFPVELKMCRWCSHIRYSSNALPFRFNIWCCWPISFICNVLLFFFALRLLSNK